MNSSYENVSTIPLKIGPFLSVQRLLQPTTNRAWGFLVGDSQSLPHFRYLHILTPCDPTWNILQRRTKVGPVCSTRTIATSFISGHRSTAFGKWSQDGNETAHEDPPQRASSSGAPNMPTLRRLQADAEGLQDLRFLKIKPWAFSERSWNPRNTRVTLYKPYQAMLRDSQTEIRSSVLGISSGCAGVQRYPELQFEDRVVWEFSWMIGKLDAGLEPLSEPLWGRRSISATVFLQRNRQPFGSKW